MKAYRVHHEKGSMQVFARDSEEALEQYFKTISQVIGHTLKICSCFGDPKPLDRNKVSRIIKIEEIL